MPAKRAITKESMAQIIELMLKKLEESNLTSEDAKVLGYKPLNKSQVAKLLGYETSDRPGFQIPYFDINGDKTDFSRIRYIDAFTEDKGFAKQAVKKKKKKKYTQPEGLVPRFYLPPIGGKWSEISTDPEIPIIITEGEFKAACACKYGYPTIGLGGVWSWRSRKRNLPMIDDFKKFNWQNRDSYLIFDSDLRGNEKVKQALNAIANELTQLGANVYIGYLPDVYEEQESGEQPKTGLDDFITVRGADALEDEVLATAEAYHLSKELWRMNDEVVFVTDPGCVLIQKTDQIMTSNDFKSAIYAHWKYKAYDDNGNLHEKATATEWLRWPHRFELKRMTFNPGEEKFHAGEYNIWKGWGAVPSKGSVKPWTDLMDHIFQDDAASRQWFERWCAIQVQRPGVKLHTAVLFWGIIQGSGKSLVGKTLGKIFGTHFAEIGNSELHSSYNDWAIAKQFVLIDEIASADRRERSGDAELLKKLVTQDEIWVNPKYGRKFKLPDRINYFMTSNNPDAIRIASVDRRFFIIEVLSRREPEFYREYFDWLSSDGPAHLFQYLLEIDLGNFDPAADAPMTEAKEEMGSISRSQVQQWLHDLIENEGDSLRVGAAESSDLYTAEQLMAEFNRSAGGSQNWSINGFARELKNAQLDQFKMVIIVGRNRKKTVYPVRNLEIWRREKLKKKQFNKAYTDHYLKFFPEDQDAEEAKPQRRTKKRSKF